MMQLTPSQLSEIVGMKEIELIVLREALAKAQAKIAELENPKEKEVAVDG